MIQIHITTWPNVISKERTQESQLGCQGDFGASPGARQRRPTHTQKEREKPQERKIGMTSSFAKRGMCRKVTVTPVGIRFSTLERKDSTEVREVMMEEGG